jgi:molecular chaperone IbpA
MMLSTSVGFDRLFSMLDQVGGVEGSAPSYPPYNIARTGENDYRISVAVAGFTDADLAIEAKENTLTLRGEKQTNDEEKSGDVLYQGIAARNFERSFQLADHVQVKGASLENGLAEATFRPKQPKPQPPRYPSSHFSPMIRSRTASSLASISPVETLQVSIS